MMAIEQQIEELRAELLACDDAEERVQIAAELAAARDVMARVNEED